VTGPIRLAVMAPIYAAERRARQMVASPHSYSSASSAMLSPAAQRSAILRRWLTSRAEGEAALIVHENCTLK
jgi:hypothetical protein